MESPLHILHLEDSLNDAALVRAALESGGVACAITRVQSREDFVAALERGGIDLVLSDFSLPAFDGLSATKIVHARWPELPVILVSGTLGEELAIDSLQRGATDYVLKERLARLVPAVRRAMHEATERTKHRLLEAQFVEAQKMEVLGQLAGGVAHDFNNILGVVMCYSDLILSDLAPESPLREYAGEIRLAAERAIGLTRQLLIFSRKETVQPVVLDLNEVVKDLKNMLLRLINANIALTIVPEKELGRINADPGQVGQVLMNLVVNARDAMPGGGDLAIATQSVTLDENYARTHAGVTPGYYVLLAVSDTGTGMTEAVRAHLFEAFFTTKPSGKGTGLGLATCQTIVKNCGGHIDVGSELGKGTTFKIYFPRVARSLEVMARPTPTGPLPRGIETLLVVEDEPGVRQLACRILKNLGYEVLSAPNGKDALRVAYEHKGAPIRLVVTDVIMPLMGGKAMAEWLKTSHPDLKILFTSGYMDDVITDQGVFEAGVQFLSKPYTSAALARKVRAMLDEETESTLLRKHEVAVDQSS